MMSFDRKADIAFVGIAFMCLATSFLIITLGILAFTDKKENMITVHECLYFNQQSIEKAEDE